MIEQSKQLFDRAQRSIPGGVNSPVRAFKSVGGTPLFIKNAKGAYLYDVDGNQYIDYIASWGPMILGHAYEPVVAVAIMESQGLFFKTFPLFRTQCIEGITVNEKVLQNHINRSVGIVTALNPILGYDKTTELAKEALDTGKGILELIREKKLLTEQQIKELMDPVKLTSPTGPTKIQK